MTTTIVLAVGDSDLSDALDINDGVNYYPVPSTLKLPPPKVRTFRSRHLGTTQTIDAFREITLDIDVLATSDAELVDFYCRPIERKLEQARANSGSTPEDPRGVCLWLGMGSSSGLVYFDVDDGDLTWTRDDDKTGATPAFTLTLYLKCKPYARGKPVTYTLPTLTIGASSYAFLPQLPGDAPGLCQWQLTDASNGSVAIDTYRIGTYSMEKLGSSDYVPWIAADPYGAGTLFADTSALNGVNCARLTLSGAYKNMAIVRQPAGVAREAGKFDAFLLCRDSTAIITPPNDLVAADTGTAIAGLFGWVTQVVLVVTAVDASGNESFASPPVALSYRGDHVWTFSWNNPGFTTPTNYRLYGYNLPPSAASTGTGAGSGIWQYRQLPGTATSYTSSSGTPFYNAGGMVAQNPPSSGSTASAGAVIQPYLGVVAAGGQPQAFIAAPAVQTVVGSSKWELVPLGMYPLPSIAQFEGQAALPWCVMVAAGYLGIGTPTFDVGGILLLKHEQPSNETQIGAAGNGAPVVTTIETNRREQVGAVVRGQTIAPSLTGLVAEYLMNQGSGTSLTDTSGSGNTGVLQAGTGWALDTTIQGVTGPSNCLTVAGGSGVTIATLTNIPIGNAAYTIVALIKPTLMAGRVVQWGASSANNTSGLFISSSGYSSPFWSNDLTVANGWLANGWHVLATTYDGTTRKLYLDGVLVAQDTPGAHAATAASFVLGQTYTGRLGPVRIWSRALSAFEVASAQGQLAGYVGQATSIGKLFLGPGNALVTFDADIAQGVHDTVNAKVQPTLRFTPRYHTLKGLLG